ncbi:MAG: hypothetical protein ABJ056_02400 [Halioglobus sp.]
MITDQDRILLQAAADGELPPQELADLRARLGDSLEARAFEKSVSEFNTLLSSVPEVEPPPGLASRILEQIPETVSPSATTLIAPGINPYKSRRAWHGYAMAASLLVAVVIGANVLLPGGADEAMREQMKGTVIAPLNILSSSELQWEGGVAAFDIVSNADGLSLHIEGVSASPIALGLTFSQSDWELRDLPGSTLLLKDEVTTTLPIALALPVSVVGNADSLTDAPRFLDVEYRRKDGTLERTTLIFRSTE